MSNGMKIVHLLAPARIGGLERVVQGLAIGQAQRGHDVTVVAVVEEPMPPDHPFRATLDAAKVPIRELVVPPRGYGIERRELASSIDALKPDVVHSHGSRVDVVDGETIRKLGVPTVSTVHGWTGGSIKNRLYEYLHRRNLRRFDAVIAVSEPIARGLATGGVSSDRLYALRNAFTPVAEALSRTDARRALGIAPSAHVAGWIGRLSREKGIDVFVDAMARLPADAVVGCVIGDGPEREREAARAESSIVWKGMMPGAGRYLAAFDVFVQSSRTEGTPMALLEAMSAEVPIVATRVGGVPDVVTDDEALLVRSEDPIALATAIASVLADPEPAAVRARLARHRLATTFGADAWLDRHEEIYRLAAERRRRAMSGA